MPHREPINDNDPSYTPYIIIAFVSLAVMFLFALKGFADEKPLSPVGFQYKAIREPIVRVERYEAPDYQNDETVLIAGERVLPRMWVNPPRPIMPEEKAEFLPKEDNDVKVTATIESDEFTPVNYPL